MITTEYAADKFSAEFMNTHMRHIPQLFKSKAIVCGWDYMRKHAKATMKLVCDIIK